MSNPVKLKSSRPARSRTGTADRRKISRSHHVGPRGRDRDIRSDAFGLQEALPHEIFSALDLSIHVTGLRLPKDINTLSALQGQAFSRGGVGRSGLYVPALYGSKVI